MKWESRETSNGEKHGLIKKLANSVQEQKKERLEGMKSSDREDLEKKRKADNTPIKARYINYRGPNERLEKPYCRYAGDPILLFKLIPNEIYELPRGFVEEVNNAQPLKLSSDLLDKDGKPMKHSGAPRRLHELVPVGF